MGEIHLTEEQRQEEIKRLMKEIKDQKFMELKPLIVPDHVYDMTITEASSPFSYTEYIRRKNGDGTL